VFVCFTGATLDITCIVESHKRNERYTLLYLALNV
jgi:hypothetical protein